MQNQIHKFDSYFVKHRTRCNIVFLNNTEKTCLVFFSVVLCNIFQSLGPLAWHESRRRTLFVYTSNLSTKSQLQVFFKKVFSLKFKKVQHNIGMKISHESNRTLPDTKMERFCGNSKQSLAFTYFYNNAPS